MWIRNIVLFLNEVFACHLLGLGESENMKEGRCDIGQTTVADFGILVAYIDEGGVGVLKMASSLP